MQDPVKGNLKFFCSTVWKLTRVREKGAKFSCSREQEFDVFLCENHIDEKIMFLNIVKEYCAQHSSLALSFSVELWRIQMAPLFADH